MKIRQYEIGGVYSAPSSINIPYGRGGYGSGSGRTAAEKTPFKDATMKLLEQSGLPSDFNKTAGTIIQMMENFEAAGGDYDPSMYLATLQLVNEMKLHKAQYDEAQGIIKTNDSGEDIAMHGSAMYVADRESGKLLQIDPVNYDAKKHEILTNNDLMRVRAHYNGSAFDKSMLLDVASSTSMSIISKKIIDQAKALAETSDSVYMQQNGNMKKVIEGAAALIQEGPNGVYKFTYNRQMDPQNIEAFVNYAYNYLLNQNEKNYLKANCAARGGNPKSEAAIKDVLFKTVGFYTKTQRNPDYDKTASEEAGFAMRGGESGSGSDIEMTLAEFYSTGKGAPVQSYAIKGRNANEPLRVSAINVGPIMKTDDETPIGTATVQNILDNTSALRKTILGESVSLGGQLLSANDRKAVVYSNSDMYRVELPYTTVNGNIVPDLGVIDKVETIRKTAYDAAGNLIMSEAQIRELVNKELGGAARWDSENKEIIWTRTRPFLAAKAYVSKDRTNNIKYDSPYLSKLSKSEGSEIVDAYQMALEKGSLDASDKTRQAGSPGKSWWNFRESDDFYVGDVYFGLDYSTKGSVMTNRPRNPKSVYHEMDQRAQHAEDRRNRQFNFNN